MAEEVSDIIRRIITTDDFYKKAQYIAFLRSEKNLSLAEISRMIDIKPSYTAHIMRLLKLPEIIIDGNLRSPYLAFAFNSWPTASPA